MTSPDVTTFLRRYAVSARLATLCHRECGKTHQPKLGWVDRRSTRTRRRCSKRASSISREMGEAPGLLRGLRLSPTPLEEGGLDGLILGGLSEAESRSKQFELDGWTEGRS